MAVQKSYYKTSLVSYLLKKKRIEQNFTVARAAASMKITRAQYLRLESKRNPTIEEMKAVLIFTSKPERDFLISGPGVKDPKTR
jgi:transcriptional regulator with XRE-family HTH domain